VNAALTNDGESLEVSIQNLSANEYDGPVVVAVIGLPSGDLQEAFLVTIPGGGARTIVFDLPDPNTEGGTVDVIVDVGNNIEESNEDNNSAAFVLSPPADAPNLQITAVVTATNVAVTLTNTGGPMNSSTVRVSVTLNGTSSAEKTIALATGQSEIFTVLRPAGPGTAEIRVFVDDVQVASGSVEVSADETPTPTATTET
jgi:subtilase family serine protease